MLTWAGARGVTLRLIEPGKPTGNAYIESFNGRFRDECLNEHWFTSLAHAQVVIEAWRREYNESAEEGPRRADARRVREDSWLGKRVSHRRTLKPTATQDGGSVRSGELVLADVHLLARPVKQPLLSVRVSRRSRVPQALLMRTSNRAGWQGAEAESGARPRAPPTRHTIHGPPVSRPSGASGAGTMCREFRRPARRAATTIGAGWAAAGRTGSAAASAAQSPRFERPGVRTCGRCATCGRSASRDVPTSRATHT